MGENSAIEWVSYQLPDGKWVRGYTFNPWIGCTKVSEACKNCYAEVETFVRVERSKGRELWGATADRYITSESNWKLPGKWNKQAKKLGVRPRVFCASLADVFEAREDLIGPRARLFDLIDQTDQLDWLLLTKRPENLHRMLPWHSEHLGAYRERYWPHVGIGTTVENQAMANKRIPELLRNPAAMHFLSCEPLLEEINLSEVRIDCGARPLSCACSTPCEHVKLDWVIVGGESGPHARPMHPDWVRSLRDQCQAAGIPFFFKQWGEWEPYEDDVVFRKVGKKAAGRLLDGVLWNQFPVFNG
jgi:protein gp37